MTMNSREKVRSVNAFHHFQLHVLQTGVMAGPKDISNCGANYGPLLPAIDDGPLHKNTGDAKHFPIQ